ncbi:MAG: hypothetical protein EZS28_006076, partial [Streblomastix strix]
LSRNGILDDTNWEVLIRVIIMAVGSPVGWGETQNISDKQQNQNYTKDDNVIQAGTNSFQNNSALLPIPQQIAFEQSKFNDRRISSPGKNINLFTSQQEIDQQLTRGVPNLQTLQSFASDTLYEIIAYHTAARNQLWPLLFQYLFDPTAASSLPVVLTALLRLVICRKQRLGDRWGLMWNPQQIIQHLNKEFISEQPQESQNQTSVNQLFLLEQSKKENKNKKLEQELFIQSQMKDIDRPEAKDEQLIPRGHAILIRLIILASDIQTDCRIALPALALIRVLLPGIHKTFNEQKIKIDESESEDEADDENSQQLEEKKTEQNLRRQRT